MYQEHNQIRERKLPVGAYIVAGIGALASILLAMNTDKIADWLKSSLLERKAEQLEQIKQVEKYSISKFNFDIGEENGK